MRISNINKRKIAYYYSGSSEQAPSVQASNISFSSVTDNSLTISWTSGNGAGRLVLIKSGGAVNASPTNSNTYEADTYFTAGDQLGTGNYAIYNSTGNSVSIDGLDADTTYHIAIIEYNGAAGSETYGTAATASQATLWSSRAFGNNLQVWINPSNTRKLFQEQGATGIQLTDCDADGETLGSMYDGGINCLMLSAINDASRPVLQSGAGGSYIDFDGTNHLMRFSISKKLFIGVNAVNPILSILITVHFDADGTNVSLIDSNDGSASAAGFFIQRLGATNRVQTIAYGGGIMWNFTSTPTITAASGKTTIILTINGVGTGTGSLKIGANAAQTFNVAAGNATESSTECFVGARAQTNDRKLNGGLYDLTIVNKVVSAGEITSYQALSLPRHSTRFLKQSWSYDMNDSTKIWADTAKTTPITNGTAVRVIQNQIQPSFGSALKDLISPSAGESPLWREANINSLSSIEYDGSNDDLVFNCGTPDNGGRWTLVFIAKNDDATNGSHVFFGIQYVVITGSNYSGNSSKNGVAYTTLHTGGGNSGFVDTVNTNDGTNVFVITRNKNTFTIWNGNKQSSVQVDTNAFSISRIGKEFLAGWWLDGLVAYAEYYADVMPDKMIEDLIDSLNAEYAI